MIRAVLRSLLAALAVLTHLPTPSIIDFSAKEKGRSLIWFPLLGGLMGLVLAVAAWWLRDIEPILASVLLLTIWMFVSELRHLDALASSIKTWLFRNNRRPVGQDQAVAPDHLGVMGVMALIMMIKFAALAVLIEYEIWFYIFLAPLVARLLVIAMIGFTPIAPHEMLVHEFHIEFPYLILLLWLVFAVPLALVVGIPMTAVFVMLILIRARMQRISGGLTWEAIGATIVLLEAVALMAAALTA